MAKAGVKAASTEAKKAQVPVKKTEMDELSALALANRDMEDVERAKTGNQSSFISLVKTNSMALDKNSPAFIKGAKPLDYVISSKKLVLGKSLDVTILGMFKLYAEVVKSERDSEMAKTVRFWMPEDAVQFPVTGFFDRELPNGNILQPCHWVYVYLHDYPEIDDGLISFRSKGNSVYADLAKVVKAESSLVTELRFRVTNQDIYNEKFKKTDYYPKFEITGHNYKMSEDGKVSKTKDSAVDTATLKEILSRSHKRLDDYTHLRLVAKQDVKALIGFPGRPALPAGKAQYEDDGEGEVVNF